MSMFDSIDFANRQTAQQSARDQARADRQEAAQAMQRVRDEMLRREMEKARSEPPAPAADGLPEPAASLPLAIATARTDEDRIVEDVIRDSSSAIESFSLARVPAQAHVEVPTPMRAGIKVQPHAPDGESELANALLRCWQSEIESMASATANLPNKGVGRMIRQGVRARGYTGREAVVIERLVWDRRKEIVGKGKAAREAALQMIENGLTG